MNIIVKLVVATIGLALISNILLTEEQIKSYTAPIFIFMIIVILIDEQHKRHQKKSEIKNP